MSDLVRKEIDNPQSYYLFQLLRVIEARNVPMQVVPSSSLTFPGTEVRSVRMSEGKVNVEVAFMGLYGVDAPLPHYMLQLAQQESYQGQLLRDLLDIFNSRMYQMLFGAWKKSRFILDYHHKSSRYVQYLQYVSGLSLHSEYEQAHAYAGLFGQRVRNARILSSIVSHFLGGETVKVEEGVVSWVVPYNRPRLGVSSKHASNNPTLGDTVYLGGRVLDATSNINIYIGPLSQKKYHQVRPKTPKGDRLMHLIRRYIGPEITHLLQFSVNVTRLKTHALGKATQELGHLLCLGSPNGPAHTIGSQDESTSQ